MNQESRRTNASITTLCMDRCDMTVSVSYILSPMYLRLPTNFTYLRAYVDRWLFLLGAVSQAFRSSYAAHPSFALSTVHPMLKGK